MVTVAEELPFVATLYNDNLTTTCSNCFTVKSTPGDLQKCGNCSQLYYCSKKCQDEDWKHHKDECNFTTASQFCPNAATRNMCRMITRVRGGDLPTAFNGRIFDDLLDHADEVIKDKDRMTEYQRMLKSLIKFMGAENLPDRDELISYFGMLQINSFTIFGSTLSFNEIGYGLYLGISIHNHSCRPDCAYHFIGNRLILRAKDPSAKYSKELTISYMSTTFPRELRRGKLRRFFYFDCECERCMDEEGKLLEKSGRSLCCSDGVVLPKENRRLFCFWQPLHCSKCGKKSSVTLEQINNANQELETFCDQKTRNRILKETTSFEEIEAFQQIFYRMEGILSPYNLYLFKFVELVISVTSTCFDDLTVIERLLHAEEKAIEKFAPFEVYKMQLAINLFDVERCGALEMGSYHEERFNKSLVAFDKVLSSVHTVYGPKHPLVKETTERFYEYKAMYEKLVAQSSEEGQEEECEGRIPV